MDTAYASACNCFNPRLKQILGGLPEEYQCLVQEIRLKKAAPLVLVTASHVLYPNLYGQPTLPDRGVTVFSEEIDEMFHFLCSGAVYSHSEEIRKGFVTAKGGHRVGIVGKAITEKGQIVSVTQVDTLSLRVCRDVPGCGAAIVSYLYDGRRLNSILLASPPAGGKTTLLRDLARTLAKDGIRVCVIDEREEIFPAESGFDSGVLCDVLRSFPKAEGIRRAIRTLSPRVIFCDEIGDESEAAAVMEGFHSGVRFVLSVHAAQKEDLFLRPCLRRLFSDGEMDFAVLLKDRHTPGQIRQVISGKELRNAVFGTDSPAGCLYGGRPAQSL